MSLERLFEQPPLHWFAEFDVTSLDTHFSYHNWCACEIVTCDGEIYVVEKIDGKTVLRDNILGELTDILSILLQIVRHKCYLSRVIKHADDECKKLFEFVSLLVDDSNSCKDDIKFTKCQFLQIEGTDRGLICGDKNEYFVVDLGWMEYILSYDEVSDYKCKDDIVYKFEPIFEKRDEFSYFAYVLINGTYYQIDCVEDWVRMYYEFYAMYEKQKVNTTN